MITDHVVRVGFVILACLLLATLVLVPAQGATYYVTMSGSGANPGTEAQPWCTIQKAAATLIAGDMVFVKEGSYNERVIPHNSGNPGDYIAYIAYPGDTVTIDGTDIPVPGEFDWDGLFDVSGRSYIKVSGLTVMNSASAGIFVQAGSNHIIIEKNYTYNTHSSGIGVWGCRNIIIDGNEVELACNDGYSECITVAGTDTFEIRNNHVHHPGPGTLGGEGIDVKDGSSNGKVYQNYVHDIPNGIGIYVDAWDKHTYNIDVFRNIVHDCPGQGFAVASEAGGLLENPNAENVVIRNNICSQNLSFQIAVEADVPAENLSVDHNLIDGYRQYPGEIYGSDYVEGNPMFANPSGENFRL